MASSRETATNENVSTFGAAGFGRDYTDASNWEGDTDIDLVSATQSEVLECYDDAADLDPGSPNMSGATTSASYFRIIRPAGVKGEVSWQGHDGTDQNGVYMLTDQDDTLMEIGEPFSQIQDLICGWIVPGGANRLVLVSDGGDCKWVGVIMNIASNSGGTVRGMSIRGDNDMAVNCLSMNSDTFGFDLNADDVGFKVYALNCTAINNGDEGFVADNGADDDTAVAINCLAHGNGGDDFQDPSANAEWDLTNSSNNASEDATGADFTNGRGSQTFTFKDAGSDDYHLDGADAGAKDFGTDLSALGVFGFDDDVDWETRSGTWDIGFDEFLLAIGYPIVTDRFVSSLIFGRIVR